jgi:hypothetical protein
MRSRLVGILWGLIIGLNALPGQAQISDPQVEQVAEAIRQVTLSTRVKIEGLYSDWQVSPENISRWSTKCTGKQISPQLFASDALQARNIVVCVLRDVVRTEYQASGKSENLAVRRTAAWWMTGVPEQYLKEDVAAYSEKVWQLYQRPNLLSQRPPSPARSPDVNRNLVYDRYMKAAAVARQQKDLKTALLYFKRALDERPKDAAATEAIAVLERQNNANPVNRPVPQSTPSVTPAPNLK